MANMRIILTCPVCGCADWDGKLDTGEFICSNCMEEVFPEEMESKVEKYKSELLYKLL